MLTFSIFNTHAVPEPTRRHLVGGAPALGLLLRILSFQSALRTVILLARHQAFKPEFPPLYRRGSARYSTEKVSCPPCQPDSEGACFGLHCWGSRTGRIGAVFSRVLLGSGRLVIAALCAVLWSVRWLTEAASGLTKSSKQRDCRPKCGNWAVSVKS